MTAPFYPFNQVHFSPAEYLTSEDLLLMQRFERAGAIDFILGAKIRAEETSARYAQGYVYGFGGGSIVTSGTTRTVTNSAGLILIDSPNGGPYSTGSDNVLKPYWLAADELSTQLAVGDATHPRYDLISLSLAYVDTDAADNEERFAEATPGVVTGATFVKRRKVVLTKTVTQGTPAATPVVPATPAGTRRWAAVYVPANHNTFFIYSHMRDMRRPAGLDTCLNYCADLGPHVHSPAPNAWTVDAAGALGATTSGKIVTVFPHLRARHNARLIGVRVFGSIDASTTIALVRRQIDVGAGGDATVLTWSSHGTISGPDGVLWTPSDDTPVWGDGWEAGPAAYVGYAGNDSHNTMLGLKFTTAGTAGDFLNGVEWLFAAA